MDLYTLLLIAFLAVCVVGIVAIVFGRTFSGSVSATKLQMHVSPAAVPTEPKKRRTRRRARRRKRKSWPVP
jgi:hypothetical protein